MGQLLGIQSFFDYEEFQTLNREVSRATRRDNQALREAGEEGSVLRGVLTGSHNPDAPALEFRGVMLEWMTKMRERFAPYVIRRTIDSLDCEGKKIFGMRPYIEHVLRLKMYDWEMNALRDFAKDIVKDNPISAADTRKVRLLSLLIMHIAIAHAHAVTNAITYCTTVRRVAVAVWGRSCPPLPMPSRILSTFVSRWPSVDGRVCAHMWHDVIDSVVLRWPSQDGLFASIT